MINGKPITVSKEDNVGGSMGYSYIQTPNDISIKFEFDEPLESKNVQIIFKPKTLSFKLANSNEFIINGNLFEPINSEDCGWTFDNNKKSVVIEILKTRPKYWSHIIQGHPVYEYNDNRSDKINLDEHPELREKIRQITARRERKMQNIQTKEDLEIENFFKNINEMKKKYGKVDEEYIKQFKEKLDVY